MLLSTAILTAVDDNCYFQRVTNVVGYKETADGFLQSRRTLCGRRICIVLPL
jgi:hypothetical protein